MDALPGSPQIQNIIPTTTFFKTDTWAAPWLGVIGSLFILAAGLGYLEWRRRKAAAAGEGYGTKLFNEPEPFPEGEAAEPVARRRAACHRQRDEQGVHRADPALLRRHPHRLAAGHGQAADDARGCRPVAAIWAVEGALLLGILTVVVFAFKAHQGALRGERQNRDHRRAARAAT